MKKTGQLLKEKREAAGLSISEVALATKINPKILVAIEEGDEEHLPAKTFLKGFVRSYAGFLKTDTDNILTVFQEEMGEAGTLENRRQIQPEEKSSHRGVEEGGSKGLRAAAVVVIVVLIGVIIGVKQLIEKYQKEKIVVATPDLKLSPLAQPSPVAPTVSPALDKITAVKLTPPPAVKAEKIPASTREKPKEKPAPKAAVVTKPAAPASAPVAQSPASAPAAATTTTAAKTKKRKRNEIILEALDKVSVKMRIHGETKVVSLAPTEVHTIYADQPVTLDFSDGGAVNVILNGRIQGVPGDLGKPKQIKIP